MTSSELSDFLKTYNLTQKKFSSMIGTDFTTVNRWINGHVDIPQYVKLYLEKIEPSLVEVSKLFKQMELKQKGEER